MISYSILACLVVGLGSLLCAACLSAREVSEAQGWATEAFLGRKPVETPPAIGLVVRRQDYGDYLHLRQSVNNEWSEAFGEGDIDYPRLAVFLQRIGVSPHFVLEQAVEQSTPKTMSAVEAHREGGQYARRLFAAFAKAR